MPAPNLGSYLRRLQQAMAAETLAPCTDRDLVERFCASQDEVAFRAILDRHGAMVLNVCRRALNSTADIEDAFQATFLVLVRRGHAIRRPASLGSWLHGVARRTALKVRTEAACRTRHEQCRVAPERNDIGDESTWGEVRGILDEELARLPEANRAPLVLCYLEGRTQDEAATQLQLSKRTLRRYLERGRDLLGRRLVRRGLTLGSVLASGLVLECARSAAVPRPLLLRTAEFANHTAASLAAPASVQSARVAAITEGVLKTMQTAKYKTIASVLACGLVLGLGVQQFAPIQVSAQDKNSVAGKSQPKLPDIEPIDPALVFEADVQKQLHLSSNQVRQLVEARDKGTTATTVQGKRVGEIDQQIKKLQEEIDRLQQERDTAQQTIEKARTEQVRAAIPTVLSRDAVQELRHITLQRMQLSEVLLNAKVRSRLDLNDEQVKKIQELAENRAGTYRQALITVSQRSVAGTVLLADYTRARLTTDGSPAELLKVLTPQQRELLERLTGMSFEKK